MFVGNLLFGASVDLASLDLRQRDQRPAHDVASAAPGDAVLEDAGLEGVVAEALSSPLGLLDVIV